MKTKKKKYYEPKIDLRLSKKRKPAKSPTLIDINLSGKKSRCKKG